MSSKKDISVFALGFFERREGDDIQ